MLPNVLSLTVRPQAFRIDGVVDLEQVVDELTYVTFGQTGEAYGLDTHKVQMQYPKGTPILTEVVTIRDGLCCDGSHILDWNSMNDDATTGIEHYSADQLQGKLTVLPMQKGKKYDEHDMKFVFEELGIVNPSGQVADLSDHFIVLDVGYMADILDPKNGIVDQYGVPDEAKLDELEAGYGLTMGAAELLRATNPKGIITSSTGFDYHPNPESGLIRPATAALNSRDEHGRYPLLVYQANTQGLKEFVDDTTAFVRLDFGGELPQDKGKITSSPVNITVYK